MTNFYEFFAGGGMARAGLGAEWHCLFANDISAVKGTAYRANWGDDDLTIEDVYQIKTSQLPGHADLAWGSFPCQDLSLAGTGQGLDGKRSGAFWGFWSLVRALNTEGRKPKIVVLENVYGALTSHDGKDFEQIIKAVTSEGYIVGAVVMDAVHFAPQSRQRLFIVGVDASLTVPDSIHTNQPSPAWHPGSMIKAYNRLSQKEKAAWRWWRMAMPIGRVKTLDDIIETEPKGVRWHTHAETVALLSMMSEVNRRKVIEAQRDGMLKVGTIYRRTREGIQRAEVRFDGVAGCLRTPTGGSSRQTIIIVDGPLLRTRLISPREAARLMGLPDDYLLPLRYNDAYHLLGDGVVVPVVAHLRSEILTPIVVANELGKATASSHVRRKKA